MQKTSRSLELILSDAMRGHQTRRRESLISRQVLYPLPLGRPSALSMIANTVALGSRSLLVVVRVAVAAASAGAIGSALGLSHTSWAIAAAVLILSQGFDQRRTVSVGWSAEPAPGRGWGWRRSPWPPNPTICCWSP